MMVAWENKRRDKRQDLDSLSIVIDIEPLIPKINRRFKANTWGRIKSKG